MASLFKRNNGIYYVAVVELDGKRRWHSTHSCDEHEARNIAEQIAQQYKKPRIMTISELKNLVLAYARTNYAPGTVSIYDRSFNRLLKSTGDVLLKSVTPLQVEQFKQHCLRSVQPVTTNIYMRTIKAAFHLAMQWKLIESNPAERCRQIIVPDQEPVCFSKTEARVLLNHIDNPIFRQIVVFALYTGTRRGEICNLQWGDVDFTNDLIRIRNRDTFRVKGGHPRTIPMHPLIRKQLLQQIQQDGYVFRDTKGKPFTPHYLSRTFRQYIHKNGLPRKYHFHSLRHTCASWLVQAQIPLYDVQQILGHRNITTTQIYSHLDHQHLHQSIEKISLLQQSVALN
jgi:integrase